MSRITIISFLFLFGMGTLATGDNDKRVHIGLGVGQGYGHGVGGGRGCQMPSVDDHLKLLSEKIGLSQGQRTRIATVVADQLAALQGIGTDMSLSREDKSNRVRRLRETAVSEVRNLLNDNQKTKFDEMRQGRHQRDQDCSLIWVAVD